MSRPGPDREVVVVNGERQFAVWPAGRAVPAGWRVISAELTHEACLAFVRERWMDLGGAESGSPGPAGSEPCA